MKIRIRGQSIRLRLGRSEVAALARGEAVEESISFGPAGGFACRLRPTGGRGPVEQLFDDGRLTIDLPIATVDGWANSDEVGIDKILPLGDGDTLRVLVEKDFACIDGPADESQADAFPNPSAAC